MCLLFLNWCRECFTACAIFPIYTKSGIRMAYNKAWCPEAITSKNIRAEFSTCILHRNVTTWATQWKRLQDVSYIMMITHQVAIIQCMILSQLNIFWTCCSEWGACSFSLSRLVCVLSQKKMLFKSFKRGKFPFLPFLPILFYRIIAIKAPLYSICLA